jgi:hypothetical protein
MITGILAHNRNVAHMRRFLEAEGATVLEISTGRKHPAVRFKTREGVEGIMHVSSSPMDPMKLRNYARQAVNRATARVEHVRSQNHNRR